MQVFLMTIALLLVVSMPLLFWLFYDSVIVPSLNANILSKLRVIDASFSKNDMNIIMPFLSDNNDQVRYAAAEALFKNHAHQEHIHKLRPQTAK